MIAIVKQPRHESVPVWHGQFLAMMPAIDMYARDAFRKLRPDTREEMVQETLANAFVAFERLVQLDKADLAFASVLARYGVLQVRRGRRVGNRRNINDVTSQYAQFRKRVVVEQLDEQIGRTGHWRDVVLEDRRATPADTAAFRIDFADWLKRLPS